jgi:glycosyltransferase involved in cell wall biosynthesis
MLAHSFALPAVVSQVGGLADIAKDGVNCLTFAPGDAGQLARALIRIVSDHKLSATLKANIILERETVFSWKLIVRAIDSLYREVLAVPR